MNNIFKINFDSFHKVHCFRILMRAWFSTMTASSQSSHGAGLSTSAVFLDALLSSCLMGDARYRNICHNLIEYSK